jgi:hypothetical protein
MAKAKEVEAGDLSNHNEAQETLAQRIEKGDMA